MPGFIKVSNSQRAVSSAYVKVSGSWKAVSKAYVKVNGVWKTWLTANVLDSFDRSNSSSLGTCSNGVASWTALTGSWSIESNKATSATSPSSYPLAEITSTLGLNDLEVGVDIPTNSGQGVAFWVTDADNWWAVVTDTVTSNNYSCPSGGTLTGSTCYVTSTYPAIGSTVNCGDASAYRTYTGTPHTGYGLIFSGCNGSGQCAGNDTVCINHGCYDIYTYYTCDQGGDLQSDQVTCKVTYCGSGGSDSCMTCTTYSCNSGDGNPSGTTCTHTSSYSATNTPSYTYYTRIIRKASGTVSTVASYTHSAPVRSLKVTTSNNTVTVSAYSAVGQDTLLNTNTYTATSPTKTAVAGLVIAPDSTSQGTTFDNFYIK